MPYRLLGGPRAGIYAPAHGGELPWPIIGGPPTQIVPGVVPGLPGPIIGGPPTQIVPGVVPGLPGPIIGGPPTRLPQGAGPGHELVFQVGGGGYRLRPARYVWPGPPRVLPQPGVARRRVYQPGRFPLYTVPAPARAPRVPPGGGMLRLWPGFRWDRFKGRPEQWA